MAVRHCGILRIAPPATSSRDLLELLSAAVRSGRNTIHVSRSPCRVPVRGRRCRLASVRPRSASFLDYGLAFAGPPISLHPSVWVTAYGLDLSPALRTRPPTPMRDCAVSRAAGCGKLQSTNTTLTDLATKILSAAIERPAPTVVVQPVDRSERCSRRR
jgi:hypothetical protein